MRNFTAGPVFCLPQTPGMLHAAHASVIIEANSRPLTSLEPNMSLSIADIPRLLIVLLTGITLLAAVDTSAAAKPEKLLRHVVLFKFKSTSTPEDIKKIVEAFRELPKKISEIHSFEWGTDVSPEGKSQGFTHCFLVTFKTEKDRDTYLPHAAHKEFVGVVRPHVDGVLVVDYWSQP
jgi:hypothetical protein